MSASISPRPHVQTQLNFLYVLPVAVGRSSSDCDAIRYVLPVLSMTTCLPIMGHSYGLWLIKRILSDSPAGASLGRIVISTIALFLFAENWIRICIFITHPGDISARN